MNDDQLDDEVTDASEAEFSQEELDYLKYIWECDGNVELAHERWLEVNKHKSFLRAIIQNIKPRPSHELTNFKWRDARGIHHSVGTMSTSHLFFVFEMIWNHTMPKEACTRDYNHYHFSPFYTLEYFKLAAWAVYAEFIKRDDATSWQLGQLEKMKNWVKLLKLTDRNPSAANT